MTAVALTRAPVFRRNSPYSKGKWVLLSVVIHVLILSAIALFGARPLPLATGDTLPLIWLDIEPLALPSAVPVRPARPRSHTADSRQAGQSLPTTPNPRLARDRTPPVSTLPVEEPATQPAEPAIQDRWAYRPQRGAVQGDEASVTSCASPHRLSERQRQICDERAGARARNSADNSLITGSGDTRRDARLQADGRKREAARDWTRSTITADETGNATAGDTSGSNFGIGRAGRHLDPSMQPDAYGPIRTYKREGRAQLQEPMPSR